MANDFHSDDAWQKSVRDEILAPQFYEKLIGPRFVFMDKGRLSDFLQRRMAVDTVAQAKDGGAVAIEEKIVRWPGYKYKSYALETESCTVSGYESAGWMQYGMADYLLYCFHQPDGGLICHLIDFPRLIEWFWPIEETFKTFQMQTRNRSRGRVVPIKAVAKDVSVSRFTLSKQEEPAE